MSPIRKVPRRTCSTVHRWKQCTNTMWWTDGFYNIINSLKTTNVNNVKNKNLNKKTCGSQNMGLNTLKHWHTSWETKFIITVTGSNDMPDLQIKWCLSLVGTLQARSNTSNLEGLCKFSGAKFPGKKRVGPGKGLLEAFERSLTLSGKDLDAVVHESEA